MNIPAGNKIALNGRRNILRRFSSVKVPLARANRCVYVFFEFNGISEFIGVVVVVSDNCPWLRSKAVSIASGCDDYYTTMAWFVNRIPGNVKMTMRVLNP